MCRKTTWDCVKTKLRAEYVDPPTKLNMWVKRISGLTIINGNTNLYVFTE